MAIEAGAIRYTVETDTSSQLKAEKVVDSTTKSIVQDFNKVDVASRKSAATITKSSKAVKTGMASMGRASGQAGIQFQQFIGQVQGGQSVMLALSQQSADLGIVLGAPLLGAIAGITASLAGILITALSKTSVSVEELTEKLKELTKTTTLTAEQANVLIAAEAETSKQAAKTIAATQKRITSLEFALIASDKLIASTDKESEHLESITKGNRKLRKELDTQVATRQLLTTQIEQSNVKIATYNALTGDKAVTATKKQTDAVKELIEALKQQELELGKTEKEIALMMATEFNATEVEKQAIAAHFDSINAFKDKEEALKATAKAQERAMKAEMRAEQVAKRRAEREKEQLTKQVSRTGLTPEQALMARQTAEIEILRQGFEQKLLTEQDFLTRSTELNRQHQEQVQDLNEKTAKDAVINWQSIEDQSASALTSIVTGAQTGREAMAALAQSVLTQMIGALIKMGIQAVIGQTTAAAAGVATAATLATAYAPAAALASLASFGANAVPAAAGITSTVALAQGLSLAGAREHGGPVSAGKSFLVGERGPEIFTPGAGGNVTSNKESFGGTTLNVLVENNTPSQVSTQLSDNGKQLKIMINEVANQIRTNQGPIPKAFRQSTNTTFKTSR